MRAATRERIISIMALVLVIGIGFLVPKAAAQSDKYPKMAPDSSPCVFIIHFSKQSSDQPALPSARESSRPAAP